MKNTIKWLGIIALVMVIGFSMAGCENEPAHVHEWEWLETTPPTLTAGGEATETCKTCKATRGTRPIAKLELETKTYPITLKDGALTFTVAYKALPADEEPAYLAYIKERLEAMMNNQNASNVEAVEYLLTKGNSFTITIKYGGTSFTGMNWNTAEQSFEIHNDWISTISGNTLSPTIFRDAFNSVELPTQTYTVTFDADNGSQNTTQTITEGGTAEKPADPAKDGYNFDHWFNAATNTEWDFNTPVTAHVTLKAKWNRATAATPTVNPPAGAVTSGTTVTLESSTAAVLIYYTTNGTTPTTGSTQYTTPISITAAVTIKAIAVKDGMNDSGVLEAAYTIFIPYSQMELRQGTSVIQPNGEYDFGTVVVDESKEISFTIVNSGNANLTFVTENGARVNLRETSNGFFSVIQQPSQSAVVAPGNTTSFVIRFTPTTIGENFTVVVTIKTNSQTNGDFSFTIKGNGEKGYATLELSCGHIIENNSSTPLSFGQAVVGGTPMTMEFTITNGGNIALNLTGDPVIESSNPVFSVNVQPATTTLSPGASTTFRVRYTAADAGEDISTISIANNSDDGTFFFTVSCVAVEY